MCYYFVKAPIVTPTILTYYQQKYVVKNRDISFGPYHPAVNTATEVTNNKFYFQKMEVGMWMMGCFSEKTVDFKQLVQFSNSWLCSPFSICCVDKKVSTHKCHDFPLTPCLCLLFLPVNRGRRRTQERKAHG